MMSAVLESLFAELTARKNADPDSSYTAQLLGGAPARPGRKLAEEAVETLIAALENDREAVVRESADVLYHLLVVLIGAGVDLKDVFAELEKRQGVSGLDEKAAR
ncbi:MAG: phosphoribosyl-ATP diphosphatase [Parvibaculales bacterium]